MERIPLRAMLKVRRRDTCSKRSSSRSRTAEEGLRYTMPPKDRPLRRLDDRGSKSESLTDIWDTTTKI